MIQRRRPLKVLVFLWLYEKHKVGWWEKDPKQWGGLPPTAYPEAPASVAKAQVQMEPTWELLLETSFSSSVALPTWDTPSDTQLITTGGLSQNTLLKIEPIQGWFIFGHAHSCWFGHFCAPLALCNADILLGKQATPFLASLYKTGLMIAEATYGPSLQLSLSESISSYLGHHKWMYSSEWALITAVCSGVHHSGMLPVPMGSIQHISVPRATFCPLFIYPCCKDLFCYSQALQHYTVFSSVVTEDLAEQELYCSHCCSLVLWAFQWSPLQCPLS